VRLPRRAVAARRSRRALVARASGGGGRGRRREGRRAAAGASPCSASGACPRPCASTWTSFVVEPGLVRLGGPPTLRRRRGRCAARSPRRRFSQSRPRRARATVGSVPAAGGRHGDGDGS
jgi:hypothetical protein